MNHHIQMIRHMLLLLPSRFIRVCLCVTPQTAAHQAPPSLGLSRQEHWSVVPFLSPVGESEVAQSCLTFSDTLDCSPPRLPRPWDSPGENTGVGCHFLFQTYVQISLKMQPFVDVLHITHGLWCSNTWIVYLIFQFLLCVWGQWRAKSRNLFPNEHYQEDVDSSEAQKRQRETECLNPLGCVLGLLNKIPQTGWFMNNRKLFSESQGLALCDQGGSMFG